MKANLKSHQNYKVRTNQKAGTTCEAQMDHLDRHIQVCTQDPYHCGGISSDIVCAVEACRGQVPCPF